MKDVIIKNAGVPLIGSVSIRKPFDLRLLVATVDLRVAIDSLYDVFDDKTVEGLGATDEEGCLMVARGSFVISRDIFWSDVDDEALHCKAEELFDEFDDETSASSVIYQLRDIPEKIQRDVIAATDDGWITKLAVFSGFWSADRFDAGDALAAMVGLLEPFSGSLNGLLVIGALPGETPEDACRKFASLDRDVDGENYRTRMRMVNDAEGNPMILACTMSEEVGREHEIRVQAD